MGAIDRSLSHVPTRRPPALVRDVVLVTGAPRSGTTVVGTKLGLATGAAALYEPMNGDSGDRAITRYFERPGHAGFEFATFDDLVARIAALDLHLKPGVFRHERGVRRLAKHLIGGQSRRSLRAARRSRQVQTVIWKDPIAALSARAAIERFDLPVVVTYRPPEAVVASFKRLNWSFGVSDMAEALGLETLDGGPLTHGLVDAAAALWSMLYGEILDLARRYPEMVTLVDMERAIADPRGVYSSVFARLGLTLGPVAEAGLHAAEQQRDATGQNDLPSGHPHSKRRNLRAANHYWRQTLSGAEVARIRSRCARIEAGFADLHMA